MEKNVKQYGSFVYITKFGTSDFEGAINALSEALEKTVLKHGPAQNLKWIIKEFDANHDMCKCEDVEIIRCLHMWSIGWKAMFEVAEAK